MHIHFIPVQLEPSTFKKEEAAQPPTPPECLAFLAGMDGSLLTSQNYSMPKARSPSPYLNTEWGNGATEKGSGHG